MKYQKRGLFYTYIIVFIHAGHAFSKPEHINNLIRAKLFNRQLDPDKSLIIIIKQTIIHGPYNFLNPTSPYDRFNNRWVVPYNPFLIYLLKTYINVEVCIIVKIVKYIYKYIYKGHDKATLQIHKINEITRYVTCRYINPAQAI